MKPTPPEMVFNLRPVHALEQSEGYWVCLQCDRPFATVDQALAEPCECA